MLREVFEQAEPGEPHVITRYRSTNANLRTQLQRIIKRAGLTPWPKLFHNLRATRETELADVYPEHVVCKWIGNSRVVARRHYLTLTDEHFAQAVGNASETGEEKAAQNQAQYVAVPSGTEKEQENMESENHSDLPNDSDAYDS